MTRKGPAFPTGTCLHTCFPGDDAVFGGGRTSGRNFKRWRLAGGSWSLEKDTQVCSLAILPVLALLPDP